MIRKNASLAVCCLFASCLAAHADSAPFGVLSAYNLVALGTSSVAGNITGPITSDSGGRIAAAGQITHTLGIGYNLGSDPWGSLANGYAVVAGGGIKITDTSDYFRLGGGGGVWASSSNTSNFDFSAEKGVNAKLTVGGTSPIDFATERTAMQTLNKNLSTLTSNGTTVESGSSSWLTLTLTGSSSTLNVFTLTAAQFDNDQLDFIVSSADSGATIIVNVLGDDLTLGKAIEINGQQEGDSNDDNNLILFNFVTATNVTINAQYDAAMLAPYATLSGTSQMGGNFIVAAVGTTGEIHNDESMVTLPPFTPTSATPEPGTITLLSSGLVFMAGALRRRKRA
jgi:choice-of-anchor A domain-containing protein